MKCDGKFNGGYIEASQEAMELLIDLGYEEGDAFPNVMFEYIYIRANQLSLCTKAFIDVCNEAELSYKQFYINNGKLSWEKPKTEKELEAETFFVDMVCKDEEIPNALVDKLKAKSAYLQAKRVQAFYEFLESESENLEWIDSCMEELKERAKDFKGYDFSGEVEFLDMDIKGIA